MRKIPDEELESDLRRVHDICGDPLRMKDYKKHGKYSTQTIIARWGGWVDAVRRLGFDAGVPLHHGMRKYSDEDLERHLREIAEDVNEPLRSFYNKENSTRDIFGGDHPSLATYINRWGREKTKEKAIEYGIALSKEERYRKWADILKERPGIHTVSDFQRFLPGFNTFYINSFISFVNENVEGLTLKKNSSGGNMRRYWVKSDHVDKYQKYREMIPEEHDAWFDFGVNHGKRPLSLVAAITYLASDDLTQKEVTERLEVSPLAIRNNRDLLVENGFPNDPPEL